MSDYTQEYKENLARQIYAVHGPELIPSIKELRARLNCTLAEAKHLIEAARESTPVTSNTVIADEWDSKKAEKWLRKEANVLSFLAKSIRDNASECSSNEDEFRCWLSNGMGIDGETEQNEIIAEIHGGTK